MMNYILDAQGNVVEEPDTMKWAQWFEKNREQRRIALDNPLGDITVSTVFLGLDHNFGTGGPPLIFETMIWRIP